MRFLLRLLLPYSGRVALAVGLGAATIGSNMGLLAAAAYLIATASVTHLMALLIVPMYAVRILSATRASARYAERLVSHRVTFQLLARLRIRLFDRFRELGPAGMQGTHSGDMLGRVMADIEELQNAYLLLVSPLAVAILVSVLLTGVLLAFSSVIAWTLLGYLIAGGMIVPLIVGWLTRGAGREVVLARAGLNLHLVDSIQGNRDIISNGAGSRFLERTAELAGRMARAEARLTGVSAGREGVNELLTNLAMLTALALAVPLVTRHAISGLYVAVPALLSLAAFEAIRPLGQAAETVSGVRAASGRVVSIGEGVRTLRDRTEPVPIQPPFSVTFEGVTLEYGERQRPAVSDIDLHLPAGGRIAVVGSSGAGKTTLARLLTRAWDPTSGRVLIGGTDIREYSLHDLRAAVGVMAQDSYIFSDTVRGNLLLARREATTADMEQALGAVGLLELVKGLPQGLDTWIGEHGEQFSGGERQRLAVARVLLQDTPIVVFDEVTANLDPGTEGELLDSLYRLTEGRTVLVITHRLVGLDRMDEIVVLDRGRVVERGRHETLCTAGGLYRRMLDVQDNMIAL